MIFDKEYLHSPVLWLRILEPYVPLRNAIKRKRLRFGYIWRNYNMVYMLGVNSNWLNALLSTVQMPKGISVATVTIDGTDNAAILAAQILEVCDEEINSELEAMRTQMTEDALELESRSSSCFPVT